VAFARALVRHRPLLLLDEPFAALDPAMRATMGNLLLDLQRETGTTVLMVTHDIDEVRRLADDVLFIEAGNVTFRGRRDAFLNHQTHGAIRQFVTPS
jgi:thiamine transport system ATP-binding protein